MSVGNVGSGPAVQPDDTKVEAGEIPEAEPSIGSPPADEPIPTNKDGSYDLKNLKDLSQLDKMPDTVGRQARCSCNSTVVGLAERGQGALLKGIQGTRDEIEKKIAAAGGGGDARAAWAPELAKLDKIEKDVKDNKLGNNDLSELSSTM